MKLSASGLSTFLRSPKAYYWKYVAKLEPLLPSVATFDHDKIFGIVWAEFVDRFYQKIGEGENRDQTLHDWCEKTEWMGFNSKPRERLTEALGALMPQYYNTFSPDDGVRVESEKWVENDLFVGRLDGLGERLVHEVKSTKRSPLISEQLWKVQNSLQVRLYCVLTGARNLCIEFAFKDAPYTLYRGPLQPVGETQLASWERELDTLGRFIQSLGEEPTHYPCNPDGCCLVTQRMVSMCPYQLLCSEGLNDVTKTFYKTRETRR